MWRYGTSSVTFVLLQVSGTFLAIQLQQIIQNQVQDAESIYLKVMLPHLGFNQVLDASMIIPTMCVDVAHACI